MRTFIIEFHGYEGFGRVSDGSYTAQTIAFCTFTCIKHRISALYKALRETGLDRDPKIGRFTGQNGKG